LHKYGTRTLQEAEAQSPIRFHICYWVSHSNSNQALSALPAPNLSLHHQCCVSLQAHTMPLAEPFEGRLTRFQKLLVLRCLRPDRVLAGVQDFVALQLGSRFFEPPPFDLAACFKESSPTTPLVFVLSPGTDVACWLRLRTACACCCWLSCPPVTCTSTSTCLGHSLQVLTPWPTC
jgi:hypothetical protein